MLQIPTPSEPNPDKGMEHKYTYSLPVGMHKGKATVYNSLAVSYRDKHTAFT